jgi:hypothetical protein
VGAAIPARRGDGADPACRAAGKAVEDVSVAVRGLHLLSSDKVWDRVRRVGLDELMQFDWTLVGEVVAVASGAQAAAALDQLDIAAAEARLSTIREVMTDRQPYIEIS